MKRRRARLRPKARKQRVTAFGYAAAAAAVLFLMGMVVRAKPWTRIAPRTWTLPLPRAAAVETLELSGAPAGAEDRVMGVIGWTSGDRWAPWETRRVRSRLTDGFSFIREARSRRSWTGRSVRIEIVLREPVARIVSGGKDAGLLDREGVRFRFPERTYDPARLPEVELGGLSEEADLKPLSRLLTVAQTDGTLPSRLVRFDHETQESGWTAALEDGTKLLWGQLEWTDEKFVRLAEVLADAGTRFDGGLTADLRYFEDGKILVRPG